MKRFMVFAILISSVKMQAQDIGSISGRLVNVLDRKIENIEIRLNEPLQKTYTDAQGNFTFNHLKDGFYDIYALWEGETYGPFYVSVANGQSEFLEVFIDELHQVYTLETVKIQAKTISEKLKNTAIKAEVVTIKENAHRASSVEEIVNRTPGVKIRNVGGMGAADNIVIGGFTGNSIKFLYDDIPIDYLGSNYGLTKVPTNTIDRIEIYKGVLPTKIGVDALGSAVNIIPISTGKTTASATFESGSFGTYIYSLNANVKLNEKLFVGTNSFYNYSKNNYKVDRLPYRNPETGQTQYIRSQLFHNAFEQLSLELFVQGRDLKWADLIEFKVNSYGLEKEIQNDPYSRARAFGEVYRKENGNFIPSFRYKKYFLDNRLSVNQFLVFSRIDFELFDRAKNVSYDWLGQQHPTSSGSEMGSMELKDGYLLHKLNQFTSRTHLNYLLSHDFQLESNTVFSHYNHQSNLDDFNPDGTQYSKLISSWALNSRIFDRKLESNTQLKYLYTKLSGKYNASDIPTEILVKTMKTGSAGLSFSQAFKYSFNTKHFVRFSYENTYRLPEQNELFGNNHFVLANYELKPEKSNNFNLGYVYDTQRLRMEVNTYYRNTKDMIRLKDINQYQALYGNLDHVKGFAVELEAVYRPTRNFVMTGNLSWNDFRLESSADQLLNGQHYKDARIANMPFYYSNLGFSYNLKELFNMKADLTFFWDYSFVHQYYLDFIEKQFEPDGFLGLWGQSEINTSRIIPVQHLNSAGIVYQRNLGEHSVSLSFELKNLFDSEIYNEFKMQSPGRNFRLKLTYAF